jgi:hypothetical protein
MNAATITPLRLVPRPRACTGFEAARQRMLRELAAWIAEGGPSPDLVEAEAAATASAAIQVAQLLVGTPK